LEPRGGFDAGVRKRRVIGLNPRWVRRLRRAEGRRYGGREER
jgi:hypothetical protein